VSKPRQATIARKRSGVEVEGLVVRTESGFHRVLTGDQVMVCKAPKRILSGPRTATTAVVIGDRVSVRDLGGGQGMVEEVLPRTNELVRGSAGEGHFLDVIAANLDQLVVVHSLKEPELVTARLDRFVLIAEAAEISAVVCINKIDLAAPGEAEKAAIIYRRAGYRTLLTSAKTLSGVNDLREVLTNKISALVGPSGTGKSSLLNDVQPGLRLRTGDISLSTGKGRHTTTTAELLSLSAGGWVADTPGLRELAIREVEAEDLAWLFPEMRPFMTRCKFTNCTHRGELSCAIRGAVERREIGPERYGSYLRVYEDLVTQRPF
jgi:ribosome biogenesis GTPase